MSRKTQAVLLKIKNAPLMAKARRHWLTLAFLLGFLVDNITLNRVDQVFDNIILLAYVLIAMIALFLLYAGTVHKLGEEYSQKAVRYMPIVLQYAYGGLLSGMLIFYGRSGSWLESWPFLLVILIAIYFNETLKDRSSRLIYNLIIFFIGLFSYVVLVIPVLTGKMGPWVFVGSGVIAALLMYLFVQVLYRIIPNFLNLHMSTIVFSLGCVFVGFNFFYFTNIIPPIPLSLKEIGIYHSVIRFEDTGVYQVKYEEQPWWAFWRSSDKVFHPKTGDNIFCFAQVFAPTRLSTEIEHHWEFYNEEARRWEKHAQLAYPIVGGRGDGYRGYTFVRNYKEGKWRCSVETKRGQVVGRKVFYVESDAPPGALVTEER